MAPRWAEKLEAQHQPQQDSFSVLNRARANILIFALLGLVGSATGRWIAFALLQLPPSMGAVVALGAIGVFFLGLLCVWRIARTVGSRAAGAVLVALLGLFGSLLFTLLHAARS